MSFPRAQWMELLNVISETPSTRSTRESNQESRRPTGYTVETNPYISLNRNVETASTCPYVNGQPVGKCPFMNKKEETPHCPYLNRSATTATLRTPSQNPYLNRPMSECCPCCPETRPQPRNTSERPSLLLERLLSMSTLSPSTCGILSKMSFEELEEVSRVSHQYVYGTSPSTEVSVTPTTDYLKTMLPWILKLLTETVTNNVSYDTTYQYFYNCFRMMEIEPSKSELLANFICMWFDIKPTPTVQVKVETPVNTVPESPSPAPVASTVPTPSVTPTDPTNLLIQSMLTSVFSKLGGEAESNQKLTQLCCDTIMQMSKPKEKEDLADKVLDEFLNTDSTTKPE